MKTLFLSITLVIFSITLHAQSDTLQPSPQRNAVRISVVDLFMNTFYMEYERMFKNHTSILANGEIILGEESSSEYLGYGFGAQYRIFSNELGNNNFYKVEGLYLGPSFHYRTINLSHWDIDEEQTFTTLKAGVILGIQITFADKINLDINFGGGIQIASGTDDEEEYYYIFDLYEPDFTGIKPMGNITLGLKF